jgi:hypothetical protein
MSDHFTETTSQGFGSRFGSSLAGLLIGPLLIIGAIVLLWWNEGRAVEAIVGLKDAASQVVEADASGPSPANKNKLVHVTGEATAQSPIEDSDVGLTFDDQVAVARTAEMYQWKEDKKEDTEEKLGGGTTTTTTYDYTRVWSDDAINSSEFKHPENHGNPEMPFRNARFTASDAKLGGWALDADILDRVNFSQTLAPEAPEGWKRSGENYYRGDPAAPKVGDMRVRYVGLPSGTTISVLAKQSRDGFAAYTAKNGYEVELAAVGDRSAAELIEGKRKSEAILTWVLRGVGDAAHGLGLCHLPRTAFYRRLGYSFPRRPRRRSGNPGGARNRCSAEHPGDRLCLAHLPPAHRRRSHSGGGGGRLPVVTLA